MIDHTRAPTLQTGNLLLQQFVLEQHLAEPRFEPLALERLAIRGPGREGGLARRKERITPCDQRSGRDAKRARHRLQILPRSKRSTASRSRCRDIRPPRPNPPAS